MIIQDANCASDERNTKDICALGGDVGGGVEAVL